MAKDASAEEASAEETLASMKGQAGGQSTGKEDIQAGSPPTELSKQVRRCHVCVFECELVFLSVNECEWVSVSV